MRERVHDHSTLGNLGVAALDHASFIVSVHDCWFPNLYRTLLAALLNQRLTLS